MARLYANENFPLDAVQVLRQLGHDVLTSADAGQDGRAVPDKAVLSFAAGDDRAVVTFDRRDFIRLHADRPEHGGIIDCTTNASFTDLARRVHEAISADADLRGKLVRVYRSRQRDIVLDYNTAGQVVCIEVLDLQQRVPGGNLRQIQFEVAQRLRGAPPRVWLPWVGR